MNKASITSFKDLLYIEMGQSPKSEFVNNDGEGIPLLNGPAEFTSKHPVPKQFTTKGNRFSEKLDILFCVRGSTTGRMNIADQKYAIGRGLAAIRHLEGSHLNSFVRGLIEQNLSGLLGGSMGSVFPNITKDQLLNYKCVVPILSTQKQIAKVLSDLDAKIDINNKINQQLEAMAKTLYDYWFVQFDFPDKNGKPYKSSGGKMVFNEELKREIPEGWEVKNLTDEMDLQYGFPFSTKLFNSDKKGVPVIRIRDILKGSISIYSTEDVDEKYRINKGDILVGMDGNFHINYWNRESCYLNQRCLRIRSKENSISEIQARYLIEPYIQAREKNVSRTTVAHLSARDVNDLKVIVADSKTQNTANKYFKSTLEKIVSNREQNQKLFELRDWLLPMLMNGQVRVSHSDENQNLGEVAKEKESFGLVAEGGEGYN